MKRVSPPSFSLNTQHTQLNHQRAVHRSCMEYLNMICTHLIGKYKYLLNNTKYIQETMYTITCQILFEGVHAWLVVVLG